MRYGFLAALFLACTPAAANAEAVVYPLSTIFDADGAVQKRFAYYIREELRGSKAFRLVANTAPGFRLRMSMLDVPDTSITSYAMVVTFAIGEDGSQADHYLYSTVGYCGSASLKDCAVTIAATLSSQADELMDELAKSEPKDHL